VSHAYSTPMHNRVKTMRTEHERERDNHARESDVNRKSRTCCAIIKHMHVCVPCTDVHEPRDGQLDECVRQQVDEVRITQQTLPCDPRGDPRYIAVIHVRTYPIAMHSVAHSMYGSGAFGSMRLAAFAGKARTVALVHPWQKRPGGVESVS
jgi:hypothetical protein